MNKTLYGLLLGTSVLATLGGIATLIPWEGASYPNVMGYASLCTFAPAATFFCFFLAGVSCYVRASLVKHTEGSVRGRLRSHSYALVPLVLVLVLALSATGWNILAKAPYRDDVSGASALAEP